MLYSEDGLNCEEISNTKGIRVQKNGSSYQIQGDLVASYKGMIDAALDSIIALYKLRNCICVLMDPPWDNTGYELGGYPKLKNKSWMNLLNFN